MGRLPDGGFVLLPHASSRFGALGTGLIVAIALLAHVHALAAEVDPTSLGRLAFEVDTDREGLPQSSVESMAVDARGYLWVCTRDGAASYDGQHWRVLDMPERTRSNWPRVVLAASDGSLWFGTEGAGVNRFRDHGWTTYDTDSGLPSDEVSALAEVVGPAGDEIWAGTSQGLAVLSDGGVRRVDDPDGPGNTPVLSLLVERTSGPTPVLWVGTYGKGLFRVAGGVWTRFGVRDGLPSDRVLSLFQAHDGALWVGTETGVARLADGRLQGIGTGEGAPSQAVTTFAESFGPDGRATLWLGTEGGGLVRRDDRGWSALGTQSGLPSSFVYSLLTIGRPNATRLLLVGTLTGLARLKLGAWIAFDESSGLPDNSVLSLLETSTPGNGYAYWFGTADGGLARLQNDHWTIFDRTSGLPDNSVFSLLQTVDQEGRPVLWAGTNQGLARLEGGRWQVWSATEGLPEHSVVALAVEPPDLGGDLLVGTYGGGLARFDGRSFTMIGGLPDDRIEAVLPSRSSDGRTSLWVATNAGLARLRDGEWTVFDRRSGLPNDIVRSLHLSRGPDGRSTLWVGTGGGLAWADPDQASPHWRVLSATTTPALPNSVIYRIEEDRLGRLYLTTNRGVVRAELARPHPRDLNDIRVTSFTTDDGLPSRECSFGASMVDHLGRIWVGTVQGAAVLDPAREVPDDEPKPLYIDRAVILGPDLALPRDAVLRHDQDRLQFHYTLVTFFRSAATRYRSQLVGLEDAPTHWRAESTREFTNLPPGRYTFEVWARDQAGNVAGPVTFPFRIRRSAWETWWALLLYILAGAALVYGGIQLRLRALRRRNLELEELVAQRTRELEEANLALSHMSVTDPLTGARNRRFLSLTFAEELNQIRSAHSAGRRHPVAQRPELLFFLVDIDRFKAVNDRFGHAAGDQVLLHVCELLRVAVREGDTVLRWGGEEFLVLARSSRRAEAPAIAERIRRLVHSAATPIEGGPEVSVTCSVGFAPYPLIPGHPDRPSWEEVVALADRCMYAAKSSGRNAWIGVTAADTGDPDRLSQRVRNDLSAAAAAGEVTLEASFADERIPACLGPR